jgi:hypothetical protein
MTLPLGLVIFWVLPSYLIPAQMLFISSYKLLEEKLEEKKVSRNCCKIPQHATLQGIKEYAQTRNILYVKELLGHRKTSTSTSHNKTT